MTGPIRDKFAVRVRIDQYAVGVTTRSVSSRYTASLIDVGTGDEVWSSPVCTSYDGAVSALAVLLANQIEEHHCEAIQS